jgi:hypothetical protein
MKDLTVGNDVIDAALAKQSWAQRNRPWLIAGGYVGLAALLAVISQITGSVAILKILAAMGQPVLSIAGADLGGWAALVIGVLVNAGALGYALQCLARFGIRMEGAGDFALRTLGRDRG